jgi:hypothetical protein
MIIRLLCVFVLAASPLACGAARLPVAMRPAAMPAATAVLYLIGDAGDADVKTAVLEQLENDIAAVSSGGGGTPVVAFLGDNVYGAGIRDAGDPGFREDSVRLETQIDVLRNTGARGVFVPGNHDWARGRSDGLQRMKNQTAFVERRLKDGINVQVAPANGCPGPHQVALSDSVSLVFLDTQWWLHDAADRRNLRCGNQTESDVLDDLEDMLAGLPEYRHAIVLAHHPLETFGPHGGYFTAKAVVFPLTELVPWLYVPIPFLYTALRNGGITGQDLSGGTNRARRAQLEEVFRRFGGEPFVYAAGHEHTLQVMDGSAFGVGTHVVSGAGSKLESVTDVGRAAFLAGKQHGEQGYMKLEFFADGTALLSVFTDGTRCTGTACPAGPVLRHAARLR